MRGDATLGTSLARARDDREQIRRLVQSIPRTPKPVPTEGFSVLGIAEVNTLSSSMKHGTQGLDVTSVAFEAPWVSGDAPDGLLDPGEFVTVSGNEIHLAEGWYQLFVRLDVAGDPADMPDSAQVATVNQTSSVLAPWTGYDETLVAVTKSGKRGWNAMLSRPFAYFAEGDFLQLEVHYTHTATVGSACVGINGDPGIHWTILKLT